MWHLINAVMTPMRLVFLHCMCIVLLNELVFSLLKTSDFISCVFEIWNKNIRFNSLFFFCLSRLFGLEVILIKTELDVYLSLSLSGVLWYNGARKKCSVRIWMLQHASAQELQVCAAALSIDRGSFKKPDRFESPEECTNTSNEFTVLCFILLCAYVLKD